MLKQIINDGWWIVPVEPSIDSKRKIQLWHVVGPNGEIHSAPLPKYKALIELRRVWKEWRLRLQK